MQLSDEQKAFAEFLTENITGGVMKQVNAKFEERDAAAEQAFAELEEEAPEYEYGDVVEGEDGHYAFAQVDGEDVFVPVIQQNGEWVEDTGEVIDEELEAEAAAAFQEGGNKEETPREILTQLHREFMEQQAAEEAEEAQLTELSENVEGIIEERDAAVKELAEVKAKLTLFSQAAETDNITPRVDEAGRAGFASKDDTSGEIHEFDEITEIRFEEADGALTRHEIQKDLKDERPELYEDWKQFKNQRPAA